MGDFDDDDDDDDEGWELLVGFWLGGWGWLVGVCCSILHVILYIGYICNSEWPWLLEKWSRKCA